MTPTKEDHLSMILRRLADSGWSYARLAEAMSCTRQNVHLLVHSWSRRPTDPDVTARVCGLFGFTPEQWHAGIDLEAHAREPLDLEQVRRAWSWMPPSRRRPKKYAPPSPVSPV
jgi:plasmid maintenance system antidote protein VapI